MNEKLFKKLLYTGQISLEKGNFSAIGHRFVFLPPEFFVFLAEQFSKVASVKKARTARVKIKEKPIPLRIILAVRKRAGTGSSFGSMARSE